jgi:ribose 5-phosphate isomerase A
MDLKRAAAEKAAEFIQHGQNIGLGAGSAIGHLAVILSGKIKEGLEVMVYTSSFQTRLLLKENNVIVHDTASVADLDLYFDGCDQFDPQLNALKSGGGIHTSEKILAVMAKEFILVGDRSKYVDRFDTAIPLVIEFLPSTLSLVPALIDKHFPGIKMALRTSNKKDGAVITENGNYLLDIWFTQWPELSKINPVLKSFPGIVETSLFYGIAKKAVIGDSDRVVVLEAEPPSVK